MKDYCIRHKKKHESIHGWRNSGEGWYCVNKPIKYEWTTQKIKADRVKFADDLTQPFGKSGDFNKRFAELYPKQTQKMVKQGTISQKEVKNAKYVNS